MHKLFIWMICSVIATPAMSQAFGVDAGQPVSRYQARPSQTEGAYKIVVPQPNGEFESYTAIAHATTGICKVWGVGRDHSHDKYGSDVKQAYVRLKEVLNGKYGRGQSIEFIRSAGIWTDDDEWVMSIRQNERTHATFWTKEQGAQLPPNVAGISLEIRALDSSTAYVDLTYEFSNFAKCRAAFQAKENLGL